MFCVSQTSGIDKGETDGESCKWLMGIGFKWDLHGEDFGEITSSKTIASYLSLSSYWLYICGRESWEVETLYS